MDLQSTATTEVLAPMIQVAIQCATVTALMPMANLTQVYHANMSVPPSVLLDMIKIKKIVSVQMEEHVLKTQKQNTRAVNAQRDFLGIFVRLRLMKSLFALWNVRMEDHADLG